MFGDNEKSMQMEGLAKEALAYAHATPCDLTSALVKVAEDNMLNPNEIEAVCHKMNHMEWKEKRADDKMSTFDAAKHADASEIAHGSLKQKEKVATIEADIEILLRGNYLSDDKYEKTANEIGKEYLNNKSHERGLLTSAAHKNIDTLNDLNEKQEDTYTEIYNTIKVLIQEGESLDDVYEVLSKTWGESNKDILDEDFPRIVERLKDEGVIKQEAEFNDPGEFPEREVADTKLAKQAEAMMDINFEVIKTAYIHEKLMAMLKEANGEYLIDNLRSRVKISSIQHLRNISEKIAVSPRGLGFRGGRQSFINAGKGFASAASSASKGGKSLWKEIVKPVLKKSIIPLALLGTTYAATVAGESLSKQSAKKNLLQNYPELADMDKETFNKMFNDILNIDPSLTKTPYYLAQIMLKHKEWGTMDASTVGELLKAKKLKQDSSHMGKAMKVMDIVGKLNK